MMGGYVQVEDQDRVVHDPVRLFVALLLFVYVPLRYDLIHNNSSTVK